MTKRIFEHFGAWKGTVVLLAFDDYDFQMLAIDDDEAAIRAHISSVQRSSKCSLRQSIRRSVQNRTSLELGQAGPVQATASGTVQW